MIGRTTSAFAALLVVTLLAACEREPTRIELGEETVMVHAVLRADADSALVHFARVWLDDSSAEGVTVEPLHGVVGEIRGAGRRGVLEEPAPHMRCMVESDRPASVPPASANGDGPESGCYLARFPAGIRAGERYEMTAVLPDGRVVEGVVDMPGRPEVLEPASGTIIAAERNRGGLGGARTRISWWARGPTEWVEFSATVTATVFDGAVVDPVDCRIQGRGGVAADPGAGSVDWVLNAFGCGRADPDGGDPVVPDSVHAELVVSAHAQPFLRAFTRSYPSLREREAAVGLRGAVGIFSGAAAARQPIVLVPIEE